MAVYDYICEACGTFTVQRPMAEFREPHPCPTCGADAPRAFIRAPNLAAMNPERRRVTAEGARTAEQPSSWHSAGCGCCMRRPAGMSQRFLAEQLR